MIKCELSSVSLAGKKSLVPAEKLNEKFQFLSITDRNFLLGYGRCSRESGARVKGQASGLVESVHPL